MYRLLNVRRRSAFVWIELINYHKDLNFEQYDNDKYLEILFPLKADTVVKFNYRVTTEKLISRAEILESLDEDKTNDILVLASIFTAFLDFVSVKVSVKYNYVEFVYVGVMGKFKKQ